ncbi:MAG: porin [Candidatus Poribacteria bacterium]|nr:porin [Candidatus Poribacteria bacterium]
MSFLKRFSIIAAAVMGVASTGIAAQENDDRRFDVNISGRTQMYGFAQMVEDDYNNDARLYLYLKQARLAFDGKYEQYGYRVELAYGGEDEVRAPNPGVSLNLLDFRFDIPVTESGSTSINVGQFKVPYSREALSRSDRFYFADRSIQHLGFQVGRDVGAALSSRTGNLVAIAGVFTGGGRDVPERFLPQAIGFPLVVLRVGYDSGVDTDLFALEQSGKGSASSGVAAYVNATFIRDSSIGHTTVLNVKTAEKSLLGNSNWNPFIGQRPLDRGDLWFVGADVAYKTILNGNLHVDAEAEFNHGKYENEYGSVDLTGGRAQVGVRNAPFGFALRYAFLSPSMDFTVGGLPITGDGLIHEITPAVTYQFNDAPRTKFVVDFPILIDVPVVMENGVGAYVLTEQPDQTTIIAAKDQDGNSTGSVNRQTVYEARLLIQTSF